MSDFAIGNRTFHSTQLDVTANPTTLALLAQISSAVTNQFITSDRGKQVQVTWVVGASTNATWKLEQALSTGLGSTAIRTQYMVLTPTNQSGQYVTRHTMRQGDILRAHLASSFTGNAAAHVQVEPLD